MAAVHGHSTSDRPIDLRRIEILFGNLPGAREGWESMIAWLVRLDHPTAKRVEARGGDGGIDVMVGELSGGEIEIWQAKYVTELGRSQRKQIDSSFGSALASAKLRGNAVRVWVLCIPIDLDRAARTWWDTWQAQNQRSTGVSIRLLGASELVELIARDKARDLRAYFFGDRSPEAYVPDSPSSPASQPAEADSSWRAGDVIRIDSDGYLLYEGSDEWHSTDRAVLWREGAADRTDGGERHVYLRQISVLRQTSTADGLRDGLREQARVLAVLGGRDGLPKLLRTYDDGVTVTVVTVRKAGPSWRDSFGPGSGPADRISAARMCVAATALAKAMAALHGGGHSHRTLSPDTIVVTDRGRRAVPRDAGLVALPPTVGEARTAYPAPEQSIVSELRAHAGARTDIYQFGALLYHTLTGHLPSGAGSPPVRATNPDVPTDLDDLVRRCLERDPRRRPAAVGQIVGALAEGRRKLSHGNPW